jgi:hypothetical protein
MVNSLSTVRAVAVAGAVVLLWPAAVTAQQSKSAPLAQQLTQLLDKAQLDSLAAKDPSDEDRYVAALYFAGSQLLVVSARYPVPILLDQKIEAKDYRDVYIDLNSAAVPDTRTLVVDLGANGLRPKPQESQPYDTFDSPTKSLACDGNWRRQNMSEQDYMQAFGLADEQYAAMLAVLLAQIKGDEGS